MNPFWFAFWFFLPAGLANMSPVLFNKIPLINRWDKPIDFGKSWIGKRIFGDNKTWRGLVGGTLVGIVTAMIVHRLVNLQIEANFALLGALLGFGAIAGDAAESFFKRQFGIKPGDRWFPFDQLDYIVGGLLASSFAVQLTHWWQVGSIFVVYFGLHLIVSYIGYLLKLKSKPL